MPKGVYRLFAKGNRAPFFVGIINSLMPCGPLQAMWMVALATGNVLAGALSMFFFRGWYSADDAGELERCLQVSDENMQGSLQMQALWLSRLWDLPCCHRAPLYRVISPKSG